MPQILLAATAAGYIKRHETRRFFVGDVPIGGVAPVSIQSMTNTDSRNAELTLAQIKDLARCGCDIIRIAVPDTKAAIQLPRIMEESPLPVIADIHFDYRLALAAIEAGIHCVRINPGTISSRQNLEKIALAAAEHKTPVRIGVNSGSLEDDILARYGEASPEAMTASAINHCRFFENLGCHNIKVSLKTSRVTTTVASYRLFASQTDYPLHIGVTEAGTARTGTVKSAVGIGTLLLEGIGDTLRVSLTGPPREEVIVARQILEAAGLRTAHPDIVSCPTCGRTEIEVLPIVSAVENELEHLKSTGHDIKLGKIAVMGCVVNGPGEARDADLGIAGGKGKGVLFKHGSVVKTLKDNELLPALLHEIRAHAVPHRDAAS